MVISIIVGVILSAIMLIFGLWGGADILALICLSFLSPISIQLIQGLPSIYNTNYLELILPVSLSLVMNAALLQIPLPIIIFVNNWLRYKQHPEAYDQPKAPRLHKLFASFLGEPLLISSILTKPVFHYQTLEKNNSFKNTGDLDTIYPVPFIRLTSEPLLRWKQFRSEAFNQLNNKFTIYEEPQINILTNRISKYKWSFDFSIGLKSEEEDLYRQRTILQQAIKDRKYLWVQYSIPFLIPMLIGYVLAFNGINILFEILKLL